MSHEYMLYNLLLQGQLVSPSRYTTCNFIVKDTGTRRLDPPFSTKLNYTYLREKINLVKFNFVEKGGSTGKRGGGSRHTYLRETN